jgi:polyhydroxybutyrate depolymerase
MRPRSRTTNHPRSRGLALLLLAAAAIAAGALIAGCGSRGRELGAGDTGSTTGTGPRPAPIIHRGAGLSFSQKVPLLISLPGLGGTPTNMERGTRFDQLADRYGFVVAYLASDNQQHPWSPGGDDLPYVSSMIDQLTQSQNIDPSRVYVTGFSAGAAFTYIVGCKLSSKVAAIAPVSAVMNTRVTAPCTIPHPISVLTIMGSRDGAYGGVPPYVLSATQTAAAWQAKDQCPANYHQAQVGSAAQRTWTGCVDGSAVGLYTIIGGTHIWPGDPSFNLPPSNPDAQFDASPAIWAFVSQYRVKHGVSARLLSYGVRAPKHARQVVARFRLGELVTLSFALLAGRNLVTWRLFRLGAGSARPVLAVPRKIRAGRYRLVFTLTDAYDRTSTFRKRVRIP